MENKPIFEVFTAEEPIQPILISIPHAGTLIPKEDQRLMTESIYAHPPDTDWHVDQLYDFAPSLGVTCIKSNVSRYIIDLNRPVDDRSLYHDGRRTTGLIPMTTFSGKSIYQDEVDLTYLKHKRISLYYEPYYQELQKRITSLKQQFGICLVIDAHSIKRFVPSIRSIAFPDIILGNNDGKSCDLKFINLAYEVLSGTYHVTRNDPFKGGNITRTFGQPDKGIHTLQIEMSQDLYLDESKDTLIDKHLDLKTNLKKLVTKLLLNLNP